jgi:hypothetical protein
VVQRGIVGDQYLGHAGQFRGGGRSGGKIDARHQYMHFAKGGRGGNGAARRLLDARIVKFEENEARHRQITFASVRSLFTSSATEPTFWPALRFGGSETLSTVRRGVTSTPRSAGFMLAIGFFRAFMMFGSDA